MTAAFGTKNILKRGFYTVAGIAELALEAVWPDVCLICGRSTLGTRKTPLRRNPPLETFLCPECQKKLVAPASKFCERCAAAIPSGRQGTRCGQCRDQDWYFDEIRPLCAYVGLPRAVVLRLKHSKDNCFIASIARLYCQERRRELEKFAPDCVVAVPMYWSRKYFLRHGVNGPEGIARKLAQELKVPDWSRFLRRVRATSAQTSVEWSERVDNISGAFSTRTSGGAPVFVGKRVLLVDDAFTSGATANEVSRVLVDGGATTVCVAVLTRAGLGRRLPVIKK